MEFSGVNLIYYVHHAESKNKVAELDLRKQFFSSVGRAMQINFQTCITTTFSCCSGMNTSLGCTEVFKASKKIFIYYELRMHFETVT